MATTRKLVYPHPKKKGPGFYVAGGVPGGLHETGGLGHNWSYDFMAPGGTPIYAVEKGRIWRLSGHDPDEGVNGSVYGWSTYLQTPDGLMYYLTHQDERYVTLGQIVAKGQKIGRVGSWPHDPGRSHTHLGVSHPMGDRASKRAIRNVTEAPTKGAK